MPTVEPAVEPKPTKKQAVDVAKINLTTVPGKQITKDAAGYHFENITIGFEVPITTLATAVDERLMNNEKNVTAMETFKIAKARLNQLIINKVEPKNASRNGVINYTGGVFSNHAVAPEVYIRIIEDSLKKNPTIIKALNSVDRMYILQKLVETIKVI